MFPPSSPFTSIKGELSQCRDLVLIASMQVHSSIADILCAQEDLGDAAPYIPTFYQYCEPIKPCPEAEVSKT